MRKMRGHSCPHRLRSNANTHPPPLAVLPGCADGGPLRCRARLLEPDRGRGTPPAQVPVRHQRRQRARRGRARLAAVSVSVQHVLSVNGRFHSVRGEYVVSLAGSPCDRLIPRARHVPIRRRRAAGRHAWHRLIGSLVVLAGRISGHYGDGYRLFPLQPLSHRFRHPRQTGVWANGHSGRRPIPDDR